MWPCGLQLSGQQEGVHLAETLDIERTAVFKEKAFGETASASVICLYRAGHTVVIQGPGGVNGIAPDVE